MNYCSNVEQYVDKRHQVVAPVAPSLFEAMLPGLKYDIPADGVLPKPLLAKVWHEGYSNARWD